MMFSGVDRCLAAASGKACRNDRGYAVALLLSLSLSLGACSASGVALKPSIGYGSALYFGEIRASFVPQRDRTTIAVETLNRSAIVSAILVMPDGTHLSAYSIDTTADPQIIGNANAAGAILNPQAASFPSGNQGMQGVPQTQITSVGQIASAALIRLTSLDEYRKIWAQSRIEIVEGEGASQQKIALPAPKPRDD